MDAGVPVPGDPAIYAPDGWPLRIGDRVTDEDRDRLRKEFLSPYQWAIHVLGDQLYAAQWDWPDEQDHDVRPGVLVDEEMYLEWREWQRTVAARRERRGIGR